MEDSTWLSPKNLVTVLNGTEAEAWISEWTKIGINIFQENEYIKMEKVTITNPDKGSVRLTFIDIPWWDHLKIR